MTIGLTNSGDWKNTFDALNRMRSGAIFSDLDVYGRMGVNALSAATPVDTGLAAHSWDYRIIHDSYGPGIEWHNTDIEGGKSVVILIQYGHGTGTGGYVQGRDFINPTMRPVFDYIVNDVGKKVNGG